MPQLLILFSIGVSLFGLAVLVSKVFGSVKLPWYPCLLFVGTIWMTSAAIVWTILRGIDCHVRFASRPPQTVSSMPLAHQDEAAGATG